MSKDKLETISNLFEGNEIRSIWDNEKEEYYFSVVDVISALTNANIPRNYWSDLKRKLKDEGSQLHEKIVQLKMKSKKDGKNYLTDTLDTKGILRLIESVPSPKAEPFKLWLANLGSERIDEVFDPEIAINRAVDYYRKRGYSDKWIKDRLDGIVGMKASEYKAFKGLRKESLRDNMSDIEVLLTDLGETATRELAKKHKPYGLEQNKKIARMGGNTAKVARDDLERKLGESVITKNNNLNYKYIESQDKIENK